MSTPKGYSSQEKEDRLSAQFQTVEPVRELQFGSSVVSHQYVYEVATDAVEAGTTAAVLVATGHSALKGDVVRITSGALAGYEAKVWSVAANSITLAETLPAAPGASDAIQILRHKYPTVEATGEVKVSGVFAEVATAASGDPLPAVLKVAGGYDGSVVTVLKTDAAGELQVDVLSSALPSGAATEATLATLATEATVATLATEATASTLATSAIQTNGSQKTQIVDGSGNVIGSTGNALDENLKSPITVDVSLSEANDSVAVFGFDGAANRALKTDAAGELQIDVLSSALPSGAATEATVATLATEATLSTIDADTSALAGCVAGTEVQVDVVSSALPSGAATEATLATLATEATLSTIDADTSLLAGCVAGTEVQVDVVSSALPSGAATEATLASLDGKVTTCNTGAVTISTALPAGRRRLAKWT